MITIVIEEASPEDGINPFHYIYLLTPWSRVHLEKLTSLQLVKKFSAFYVPEGLSPHLQVPATCPYLEPARSSPYTHITLRDIPFSLLKSYLIISSGLRLSVWIFRKEIRIYCEELLAPCLKPQAGGPPFVRRPRMLIQYIHSYLAYWRSFLHPQPEDAPCHGDRDPLITVSPTCSELNFDTHDGNSPYVMEFKWHTQS